MRRALPFILSGALICVLVIAPLIVYALYYNDLRVEASGFQKPRRFLENKEILVIRPAVITAEYDIMLTICDSCAALNNGSRSQCRTCGKPINNFLFGVTEKTTNITIRELNLGAIDSYDGYRTVFSAFVLSTPTTIAFLSSIIGVSLLTLILSSIYGINKVIPRRYRRSSATPFTGTLAFIGYGSRIFYQILLSVPAILTILLIAVGLKGTSVSSASSIYFIVGGIGFIVTSEFFFWFKERIENNRVREDVSYLEVIGYSKPRIVLYLIRHYCFEGIVTRVAYAVIAGFILESGLWYLRESGNLKSMDLYPFSIGKFLVQIVRSFAADIGGGTFLFHREVIFITAYYFCLFMMIYTLGKAVSSLARSGEAHEIKH
ncbi:MAG: hypothetical protein AABZ39_01940 [Spirochaetota bacterium]